MNAEHMEFLKTAIAGHIGWRMKLNDFAAGKGAVDPDTASKDNVCPLGKWLYGQGRHYESLPEYRTLVADHAAFHRCAGDVCRVIATGNVDSGVAQLRAENSPFSSATRTTVASVQRLREAIYNAKGAFRWNDLGIGTRLATAFAFVAFMAIAGLVITATHVADHPDQLPFALGVAVAVLFVLISATAWFSITSTDNPLKKLVEVVDHVARTDDFSKRAAVDSRDEIGRIAHAFNNLMDDLEGACTEIGHVMRCLMVGDLSNRITGGMKGKLAEMKQAVNVSADGIEQAMSTIVELTDALNRGNLDHAVNVQVQGEFKRTVEHTTQGMQTLRAVVDDIGQVMQCMAQGILDRRVEADARGDLAVLKQSFNTSLDALDSTLADVTRITAALAAGDLSQKSTKEYPGAFGQTQRSVNQTVSALSEVIAEVENIVEAAAVNGNFSLRSRMEGKRGYVRTLSKLLNDLSEVIEASLGDFMRAASGLAKGDLTTKIEHPYPGLLGKTRDGINGTIDHLTELVQHIIESEKSVVGATKELSVGNADLAQRTSEQAGALQETSANLEELATSVRQKTEHAANADRLARSAAQIAEKGGEVVQRSVQTMAKVTEASSRISDIIAVIDAIAFQTNILALNAAVEAARAGDHGRGFAVVAGEVRTLAQRSATAAKEIRALITDSVREAHNGAAEVNLAGKTMHEVVQSISQVTQIMAEINTSSAAQSESIDQISQAVQQMDEVTQQNAALVEESASVAESLENLAEGLAGAVSVFKLSGAPQPARPVMRLVS